MPSVPLGGAGRVHTPAWISSRLIWANQPPISIHIAQTPHLPCPSRDPVPMGTSEHGWLSYMTVCLLVLSIV